MRKLAMTLALALVAWGCGSGSGAGAGGEGGLGGAGGVGGEGGTGGVGGVFLDACIGDDQTIQCENDVYATLFECVECRVVGAPCPDGVVPRRTPVPECMNVAVGLSFDCATCYFDYWVCLSEECSLECGDSGDPDSCKCVTCGIQNCDDEFEACAKFRMSDGVPECPGAPACTP